MPPAMAWQMEGYPEPTPVQLISAAPGDAAAGKAAIGAPAFDYVGRLPLPPNAIDAQGGCTCK